MISTGRNAALAGRPEGLEQLSSLLDTVLGTLGDAALKRGGPLAPGGPQAAVARWTRSWAAAASSPTSPAHSG